MIEITHNFDRRKFVWLWAKYVVGFNDRHHCTNSIRGRYSKKLWKGNLLLGTTPTMAMDEAPAGSYCVLYICGVSREGYPRHENYPHNVHAAVIPEDGSSDRWTFEGWRMTATGGRFLEIPPVQNLPAKYRSLPAEYTSCRIFRWAACHFADAEQH